MSDTWSDDSGSYCEDCVNLSMTLEERAIDERMRIMIEKWEAASVCKCDVEDGVCRTMASYHEKQLCARLTCLCKDSLKLPQASLQTRIAQIIELRNQ